MRVAQAAFGALQPLPSLLELLAVTCGMLCLPPGSTPMALGAAAPLLPRACQAGRWAPMASRLAAPSAACHTRCCRAGIAKPLHSLPDGPPGWQELSAPCCPLAGCQHPRAGPLPGRLGPKLRQAGRVLGSWDRQDFQVPAWPAALERDSSESGEPQKLNPTSGSLLLHLAGCHRGRDTVVTTHWHLLPTARTLRAGTQPRSPRELLGRGLGSAGTC